MNAPARKDSASSKLRYNRARIVGVAVYVALSALSVAMGITAAGASNALGATVSVGSTDVGAHFITLSNRSDFTWNNARLDIDGRYFIELGNIPPGDQRAPQMGEFVYAYQVPRAPGLFHWESSAEESFSERLAPSDHAPATVTLRCDEGMIVQEVAP